MRIKQLKLHNIGPFAGEHSFSFHTEDPQKQIVIIGGRNGAGKTTLFEAIRLCLYGYKLYGYRQNSQTYTSKIKRLINDRAKQTLPAAAGVSMEILIEDGYANSVFDIRRQWGLEGKALQEGWFIHKDGIPLTADEVQDFDSYLMQTFPPALFNFHFLDGEKISEFIFDRTNAEPFRKAFLQICGLDTFDLIEEQLSSRTTRKSAKGSAQEDYEAARAQIAQAEERHNRAAAHVQTIQTDIDSLRDQIAVLDDAMQQYGGIAHDEWTAFEESMLEEERRRNEMRYALKTAANDVVPFIILDRQLEGLKQQLIHEEQLKRNRLFHEKLFDSTAREKLERELAPLLPLPETGISDALVNALYQALSEEVPCGGAEILKLSEHETVDLLAKIRYYQGYPIQNLIDAERSVEDSLNRTKELRVKMEAKERIGSDHYLGKKNELLMQLDTLQQQLIEARERLLHCIEELKTAQKNFQTAFEGYKALLKEKSVLDMSARALLAFGELKQNLFAKYVSMVEQSFSHNFHQLISKTGLIDGIYISSSFEIIAYKQSEVNISDLFRQIQEYGEDYVSAAVGERAYQAVKNSGRTSGILSLPVKVEQHFSAGEQQIFVMALYQSLAGLRTFELPFVMDTPLARIDSEHRKNILTAFFSQLSGQVIILSTDEEINTDGLALLDGKISDVYLLEHKENGVSSVRKDFYFEGVVL